MQLDGTTTGITNAKTAVANSQNSWNFNTTAVASPTVDFAASSAGPWSSSPVSPSGYVYARVQSAVNLPFYFAPVVTLWMTQSAQFTQTVNTYGIAAQVQQTAFSRGLDPYTAVSTNTTGPNFGLVIGNQYDIQWPAYNGTKFVSKPCSGDSTASKKAVQDNWGASLNGYWGDNASSTIYAEVLDEIQLHPITIGENIAPILSSGNKNAQAKALDTRVQQDGDYTDQSSYTDYFANPYHNGRRLIALPIVDPTSPTTTTVLGYASFLLISDGTSASNYYESGTGNDPFCAVYVGAYVQGSTNSGAAGGGAYRVGLVQ
jgi:hypothetical protein